MPEAVEAVIDDAHEKELDVEGEIQERIRLLQLATQEELEAVLSDREAIFSQTALLIFDAFNEEGERKIKRGDLKNFYEDKKRDYGLKSDFNVVVNANGKKALKTYGFDIATTEEAESGEIGDNIIDLQSTRIFVQDRLVNKVKKLHTDALSIAEQLSPEEAALLKALAHQYAGVRYSELEQNHEGNLDALIDSTNEQLETREANFRIHFRNGILILGTANEDELIHVVNCREVREKVFQTLTKPTIKAANPGTPTLPGTTAKKVPAKFSAIERDPQKTFLKQVRENSEQFSNKLGEKIATILAKNSDATDEPISLIQLATASGYTAELVLRNIKNISDAFYRIHILLEEIKLPEGKYYRLNWKPKKFIPPRKYPETAIEVVSKGGPSRTIDRDRWRYTQRVPAERTPIITAPEITSENEDAEVREIPKLVPRPSRRAPENATGHLRDVIERPFSALEEGDISTPELFNKALIRAVIGCLREDGELHRSEIPQIRWAIAQTLKRPDCPTHLKPKIETIIGILSSAERKCQHQGIVPNGILNKILQGI